ncbi:Bifunctional adenosylcobalamin biosynthesis protein CobP [Zhongshania aliphaticivorans]|uniref:Bifunctional adenosylcobalamin biosynthesis protein n=1 Tax=Zhongshania aliphaticivorans TaxID=1470434 RepID=A0A5S9N477_9GAMM|nr:bifunctional adenosylcobinamide kinase/adenosylcobinamide-phosphate guanylyltransferase [Zhongshania aliphaticivorans]CAA0082963.1 Bifunctional adenosylcobalamin biosynthesis protein CobP [Zhongshania aliphaticivorans]CAA0083839.1 Bifunctional adenosylcobalamin biosynthesis protein CobP [Zhongshania aliphaticivorans]
MLELYLGGARSGKSQLAEQRICMAPDNIQRVYIATATAGDEEMAARIAHHQHLRQGKGWRTVEAPEELTAAIRANAAVDSAILVDCLTLWLSNWLMKDDLSNWHDVRDEFYQVLQQAEGHIVLVTNEVGQGIVPLGSLSRQFVDESGRLHQDLAAMADRVVLVTAGLEQVLKG